MQTALDVLEFLSDQLADVETTWSMGTFGAVAELTRDSGETTARGGICVAAAGGLPSSTFPAGICGGRKSETCASAFTCAN